MLENLKNVLVLAPHTDDGEFGCGGTISKLIEQGANVYYVAFSSCEESIPDGLPKDTLAQEVVAATKLLKIPRDNLIIYEFKVRKFPQYRQEILEEMVKMNRDLAPDLVLLPSKNDTHQDHNVVSAEGFRAFKKTRILGYEVPWNNLTFVTNCFVDLKEQNLKDKITALECYQSQKHRDYASETFVRSLATVRGTQVGRQYAEAFEMIRWIL